jgi:hypothetical protein
LPGGLLGLSGRFGHPTLEVCHLGLLPFRHRARVGGQGRDGLVHLAVPGQGGGLQGGRIGIARRLVGVLNGGLRVASLQGNPGQAGRAGNFPELTLGGVEFSLRQQDISL